jgi:hypothetical protein
MTMQNYTSHTPDEVLATVRQLRAQARRVPLLGRGAHFQIAKRRIADAVLFAESNTAHAVQCCWEARHHLNHCAST